MIQKNKNLLLIFTRNPELGKAKTRLAKSVGDETALEIYKFLLNKTKEITQNLTCDKAVYYSVKIRENDIWNSNIYQKHQQFGEDLGFRMQNAFKNSFEAGYQKVMIIGSDLYDLSPSIIEDAFSKLNTNDVVLGPAEDGGYYLLGMKALQPNIFENKAWGTSTVRAETLNDLEKVNVHLLQELNDVDVIEDIENHPAFQKFLK
ncbi:TIGR04282 family arsenosugar biosynthesis glycosyltransferase [Tenacibaculum aquimarinum]|uniref:TIGR04282 family arsenosugar biosynthesis glycosyltransferase n=1 Tax=Tenacibaculum aquimarinum TaxID=2910675 RepID=UPI001F0A891D|nr:TIGR04282 family arsenosugar biosynthesis glycosyltransferase [Tenacibaculum aquimarinum]MCH3885892.1 TIGR04282 family arsenosugar biosynthesis glycosyltransferase [Tenacibaculum aquimarinum]